MPAKENVWKQFYRASKLDESSTWNQWKRTLHSDTSFPSASRLFALARYEAETAEPLVSKTVDDKAKSEFGFSYNFAANPEELKQQLLAVCGLKLIQNGRNQYLRTIHMLSGAVYLKAAEFIGNNRIPIENWFDANGELSSSILQFIARYTENDKDTISDVTSFFCGLKRHFEQFNMPPPVAGCIRDESILSLKMLARILEAIWPSGENKSGEELSLPMSDTRPLLALDKELRLVVKFPRTKPRFNVERNVDLVRFIFQKADGDSPAIASFRRENNEWGMDRDPEIDGGIPVDEFVAIKRKIWKNGVSTADESQTIDVTPSVLRDAETDHVLLRLDGSPMEGQPPSVLHPMEPGATIVSDQWYYVAALHSSMPSAVIVRNEKEEALPLQRPFQFRTSDGIPDGIRIGETAYPVATKATDWIWLDPSCCRWTGLRLFCEQDKIPFFKDATVSVWYRTDNEKEYLLPLDMDSPGWQAILWNRGWIVFKETTTSQEIAKRPLTFIPKVDCREISKYFDLKEEADVEIGFGDERVPIHVPPWQRIITLPPKVVRGYTGFSFPLLRKGVFFHLPKRDCAIPLSTDKSNPTKIAGDDFEEAVFEIVSPGHDELKFTVSNEFGWESVSCNKLTGGDIQEKIGVPEARRWCLMRAEGDSYYWHVYDPEKTPAPGNLNHPVHWERQNDDLVIRFWLAHHWSNHSLSFLFYPAHKQDEKPQEWPRKENPEDVETQLEPQGDGRLVGTMRVKGLYADSSVQWGCGLLSFVGFREGNHYHPVSAGFFLKAENEESFQTCDDDPYGLRMAIARSNLPAIESIMQTNDENVRAWIRRFEGQTLRSLYLMRKFDAFHSYRSHCAGSDGKESPSGYFFMAGWLLLEKIKESIKETEPLKVAFAMLAAIRQGNLPQDYKGKWSSLLIGDRFFVPEAFFPAEMAKSCGSNCILDQRNLVATNALAIRKEQTDNPDGYQRYWTSCAAFNDVPHATQRLMRLLRNAKNLLPSQGHHDCTFCKFGNDFTHDKIFPRTCALDLEIFISKLAFSVAKWRRKPTLEGAQILRDLLLEVQAIDRELRDALPDTEERDDVRKIWRPKYTMLERIAFKADIFAQSLSESLPDVNPNETTESP